MIFWTNDETRRGKPIKIGTARTLSTAAVLLYPAGALLRQFGPDTIATSAVGWTLIVTAAACAVALAGSSFQRIVGDQEDKLDEYELKLRYRAIQSAYLLLTGLGLIVLFGFQLAMDIVGIALTDGLLTGAFWGLFLYSSALPTAVLAWQLSGDEDALGLEVDHG